MDHVSANAMAPESSDSPQTRYTSVVGTEMSKWAGSSIMYNRRFGVYRSLSGTSYAYFTSGYGYIERKEATKFLYVFALEDRVYMALHVGT